MIELFENYCWTKEEQILPQKVHGMQELGNISHHNLLSAKKPFPVHYHSDFIEIYCMINGVRNSSVFENGSLHSYSVSANEAFLVYPFELHYNGKQPQKPCEYYAFQINVQNPDSLLGLNPEYSRNLYQRLLSLKNRHLRLSSTETSLLRTAFHLLLYSDRNAASMTTGIPFLTSFLFHLTHTSSSGEKNMLEIDPRIQQALNYIETNISKPLTVEELARSSHYSVSRFKARFKEEIGYPPSEYVTVQKIEHAKHLLETSNETITDLAYSLGFSSSNYFSAVFNKIMGCTPREYRRQFHAQEMQQTAAAASLVP